MNKLFKNRQAGFGHVELIIVVVIVAALAGVGYFVYNKNKNNNSNNSTADLAAIQDAIKNAKCDYDDKDLCKFFASQKVQKYYTMTSVSEVDGEATKTTLMSEGNDKSHMKIDGHVSYEVITIGKTTYTKAADGTWWKQNDQSQNDYTPTPQRDVTASLQEPESAEVAQTRYKKIGKEPCGNLTCFKYQEIDPENPSTTTYLWFDDKDYQLRRIVSEGEGMKSDTTFSYDKVSIKEPSPVKELGPNQFLMPGDSEPQTIPDAGDMPTPEEIEAMMRQYQ